MSGDCEYHTNDFEWDQLRQEIESDPSLRYHLLPLPAITNPSSSQSQSQSLFPSQDSEAWNKFHTRHSTGKFFKFNNVMRLDPLSTSPNFSRQMVAVRESLTQYCTAAVTNPEPSSPSAERRYILKEFPELLSCNEYSKVLEVGCGNGSTVLPILRGKQSITVYSCDCSIEALKRAEEMIYAADLVSVKDRFHPFLCDFSFTGFPKWLACDPCSEGFLQKQDIFLSDVKDTREAGINDFVSLKECKCCLGGVDFVTLEFFFNLAMEESSETSASSLPQTERGSVAKTTTSLFSGQNYLPWSRSAILSLKERGKLGYVNGTITAPLVTDSGYGKWDIENSHVINRLVHSMVPSIGEGYLHLTTVKDICYALADTYSRKGNMAQIFDLKQIIKRQNQDEKTVLQCFTSLTGLCVLDTLGRHVGSLMGAGGIVGETAALDNRVNYSPLLKWKLSVALCLDSTHPLVLHRPLLIQGESTNTGVEVVPEPEMSMFNLPVSNSFEILGTLEINNEHKEALVEPMGDEVKKENQNKEKDILYQRRTWRPRDKTILLDPPLQSHSLDKGSGTSISSSSPESISECDDLDEPIATRKGVRAKTMKLVLDATAGEIFTLSAVPIHRMPKAIEACFSVLKPGGLLLFRDYVTISFSALHLEPAEIINSEMKNTGLYDMTMLRFEPNKKLGSREYMRSDGTRSYFFCLDTVRDLFARAGFNEIELEYCCVKSVNRRKGKSMRRVWVHGKFQKPA
ncbi:methyltransferase family protein [Actinidia rufa]|uniref:Methyltransferase family protein n=1 Tax=Actinidia rufa TaxID=165716 RepID=A0A7J0DSL8_9ERIC|nr:methyltransferase family protein [Actinidia rufa]